MASVIKSREKLCLTNRTWPISHYIMPMVNNGLGGIQTHTHTNAQTKANSGNQVHDLRPRAPGLKTLHACMHSYMYIIQKDKRNLNFYLQLYESI